MSKSIKSFFKTTEKEHIEGLLADEEKYNLEENQGSASNIVYGSSANEKQFRPNDNYVFPKKTVGNKQRSCQLSWFKKFS